jgi:hypothetical protein
MECELCKESVKPMQPGTVWVEGADPVADGVWHEACYKLYREDYKTADDIIAESKEEDDDSTLSMR